MDEDAPCFLQLTSGTTGHPKGVRRFVPTPEQTANAERMRAMIYGLKPGSRILDIGCGKGFLVLGMNIGAAAVALKVDPSDCVYMGDAERDIVAGRAAGMKTLIASLSIGVQP